MEDNEIENVKNALEPRFWQARVKITQIPSDIEEQLVFDIKLQETIKIDKFLVLISISFVFLVSLSFNIQLQHEIFCYISILGAYYVLKYGLKGIGNVVYNIRSRRSYLIPKKNVSRNLTRRTLKPKRSW